VNTATSITLAPGQTFTANAVLQPGATITGKVTDGSGHGLSGICVDAATETDAAFGPFFEASAESRHGSYIMSNLAPGQYLINFGCELGGRYANQWFPGAPTPPVTRSSGTATRPRRSGQLMSPCEQAEPRRASTVASSSAVVSLAA
jgi:hypothetical protein